MSSRVKENKIFDFFPLAHGIHTRGLHLPCPEILLCTQSVIANVFAAERRHPLPTSNTVAAMETILQKNVNDISAFLSGLV